MIMRDDTVIKKTWYMLKYQERRGLYRFQLCKLQYWASKITYRQLTENAVSYSQLCIPDKIRIQLFWDVKLCHWVSDS